GRVRRRTGGRAGPPRGGGGRQGRPGPGRRPQEGQGARRGDRLKRQGAARGPPPAFFRAVVPGPGSFRSRGERRGVSPPVEGRTRGAGPRPPPTGHPLKNPFLWGGGRPRAAAAG